MLMCTCVQDSSTMRYTDLLVVWAGNCAVLELPGVPAPRVLSGVCKGACTPVVCEALGASQHLWVHGGAKGRWASWSYTQPQSPSEASPCLAFLLLLLSAALVTSCWRGWIMVQLTLKANMRKSSVLYSGWVSSCVS